MIDGLGLILVIFVSTQLLYRVKNKLWVWLNYYLDGRKDDLQLPEIFVAAFETIAGIYWQSDATT